MKHCYVTHRRRCRVAKERVRKSYRNTSLKCRPLNVVFLINFRVAIKKKHCVPRSVRTGPRLQSIFMTQPGTFENRMSVRFLQIITRVLFLCRLSGAEGARDYQHVFNAQFARVRACPDAIFPPLSWTIMRCRRSSDISFPCT